MYFLEISHTQHRRQDKKGLFYPVLYVVYEDSFRKKNITKTVADMYKRYFRNAETLVGIYRCYFRKVSIYIILISGTLVDASALPRKR